MQEMSYATINTILTQTKMLGGKKIDITGGEPTLRKDYLHIIKRAKDLAYAVELVTNASLLDSQQILKLKQLHIDNIAVSLDGPDYETYTKIRRVAPAQYEQVIENIKEIRRQDIALKTNILAWEENFTSIPRILEQGIAYTAIEQGIYYFTPIGRGTREHIASIDPITWLAFIRHELATYTNKTKISLEIPLLERERVNALHTKGKDTRCILYTEPSHLQILPDGNIYPCAIMAHHGIPLSNIYQKDITRIWDDREQWINYRERFDQEIFSRYQGCVAFNNRYLEYIASGKYLPVCPLRKFSIDEII